MANFAAIDVGSNAIRLLIVCQDAKGKELSRFAERYSVRLGGDVFANKRVGPLLERKLLTTFLQIARELRRRKVDYYRAVATSAMRDAKNKKRLLAAVRRKTGIRLEVISGLEEARLMRRALLSAAGDVPPSSLLVDLGGGSLELSRANERGRGMSLALGSVRLLQRFPELKGLLTGDDLKRARHAVLFELRRLLKKPIRQARLAIGTGGNLDLLARLAGPKRGKVPSINLKKLERTTRELGKLTVEARIRRHKLRPDRADVVLPAALVIESLAHIYKLKKFVVPGTGIRDAIVTELAGDFSAES